jgi:hypothetical protein
MAGLSTTSDSQHFSLGRPSSATYPSDRWGSLIPVAIAAFFLYETGTSPRLGPLSLANPDLLGLLGVFGLVFGLMAAGPFIPRRVTGLDVESWGIRLRFRKLPSDYIAKMDRWGPTEFRWDYDSADVTVRRRPPSAGSSDLRTLRGMFGKYRVSLVLGEGAAEAVRLSAEQSTVVKVVTGGELGDFAIRPSGYGRSGL